MPRKLAMPTHRRSRLQNHIVYIIALLFSASLFAQETTSPADINAKLSELNILRAKTRNLAKDYISKKNFYEAAQKNDLGDDASTAKVNNAKFQYFLIERKYQKIKQELLAAEISLQQLQKKSHAVDSYAQTPQDSTTPITPDYPRNIMYQGPSSDDEIERLNASLDEKERRIDQLLDDLDNAKSANTQGVSNKQSLLLVEEKSLEISRLNQQLAHNEAEISSLRLSLSNALENESLHNNDNQQSSALLAQYQLDIETLEQQLSSAKSLQQQTTLIADATPATNQMLACDCDEPLKPAYVVARATGMSGEQRIRLDKVLNDGLLQRASPSRSDISEIALQFSGHNTYQVWQNLQYLGEGLYRAEAVVAHGELQIQVGQWHWQSDIAHKDHQRIVTFYLDTNNANPQLFIHRAAG